MTAIAPMTGLSGKIEDMKMTWPLASVVIVALLVVGIIQWKGGQTSDVLTIVSVVMNAIMFAELREVKANTNGNVTRLMDEMASYRMQQNRITTQALQSPPLAPPPGESGESERSAA